MPRVRKNPGSKGTSGRPPEGRESRTARIDLDALELARRAKEISGVGIVDYISTAVRAAALKELSEHGQRTA